jgi:dCTP deaminase
MILAGKELRERIEQGNIGFDPQIGPEQIGTSSVDLRLGPVLVHPQRDKFRNFRLTEGRIPAELFGIRQEIPSGGYNLKPGELVLGSTLEVVKLPNDLAGRLEGRSGFARLGLMVHVTSAHIDPGFTGVIVLEMYNLSPNTLVLEPLTPIAAIVLAKLSEPLAEGYSGRFSGQATP